MLKIIGGQKGRNFIYFDRLVFHTYLGCEGKKLNFLKKTLCLALEHEENIICLSNLLTKFQIYWKLYVNKNTERRKIRVCKYKFREEKDTYLSINNPFY